MESREYKFRVWSYHSNSIEFPDNDDIGIVLDGADGYDLMQCTGVEDMDGKEIYEGDIVCIGGNPEDYLFFVGFEKGTYIMKILDNQYKEKFGDPKIGLTSYTKIKVISNVYEYKIKN